MPTALFLHERDDARDLFRAVGLEMAILPQLVEKDYWLMHCLWGLQDQGFTLELKGGTSLSKGWNIIGRFSEDVDVKILPADDKIPIGKNQDKPAHIRARADFFNGLAKAIAIPGIVKVDRDHAFDDVKMRGAGIRLIYDSSFSPLPALKEGILLEVGFDVTTPHAPRLIEGWVMEKAMSVGLPVRDNRAKDIPCYLPEYTFVEKLQTISTKFRNYAVKKELPANFLRHYADVYKLLGEERVRDFVGTSEYFVHKKSRFRSGDEHDLTKNHAFTLPDKNVRRYFTSEYEKTRDLYFRGQPSFDEIITRMEPFLPRL